MRSLSTCPCAMPCCNGIRRYVNDFILGLLSNCGMITFFESAKCNLRQSSIARVYEISHISSSYEPQDKVKDDKRPSFSTWILRHQTSQFALAASSASLRGLGVLGLVELLFQTFTQKKIRPPCVKGQSRVIITLVPTNSVVNYVAAHAGLQHNSVSVAMPTYSNCICTCSKSLTTSKVVKREYE